jgi:hypothetical protein
VRGVRARDMPRAVACARGMRARLGDSTLESQAPVLDSDIRVMIVSSGFSGSQAAVRGPPRGATVRRRPGRSELRSSLVCHQTAMRTCLPPPRVRSCSESTSQFTALALKPSSSACSEGLLQLSSSSSSSSGHSR